MMKMNASVLGAGTGCSADVAMRWLAPTQAACDKFGITSADALACFLSNIGVESGGLTQFVENLNYSAQGLAATWPTRYAVDPKGKPPAPNPLALSLARKPQAIANNVYANRLGNGTEASGDGWRYRGQGPIQITGKTNFASCGAAIGMDLVNHPEALQEPHAGALSAAWFFASRDCIRFANVGDVGEVVRRINGALPNEANNGALRISRYKACKAAILAAKLS